MGSKDKGIASHFFNKTSRTGFLLPAQNRNTCSMFPQGELDIISEEKCNRGKSQLAQQPVQSYKTPADGKQHLSLCWVQCKFPVLKAHANFVRCLGDNVM